LNRSEFVDEFNYRGILFNRTGYFNKTIKKQAEKATKAMFEVLKRGRTDNLQPLGQYRQHIKVQKALTKYSTYLLCSLKLFLNH
jgi:hypothetical protein